MLSYQFRLISIYNLFCNKNTGNMLIDSLNNQCSELTTGFNSKLIHAFKWIVSLSFDDIYQ